MTPEEKIRVIVQAAGECWHESEFGMSNCKHCRITNDPRYFDFDKENPSPTDLNELFRLAGKLGCAVNVSLDTYSNGVKAIVFTGFEDNNRDLKRSVSFLPNKKDVSEALLNALYESVKGK